MERILLYKENHYADLAIVKVTLDLHNVPYMVQDENISAIGYGTASGGSKIFVEKADFENAVKALLAGKIITEEQANDALNFGS